MYYIIGDIHGCLEKLIGLYRKISRDIGMDDALIFLGDYIDRGGHSYEVVEYLLRISEMHTSYFLMGNHEQMLLDYYEHGRNEDLYFYNGGDKTLRSYSRNLGNNEIPSRHIDFFHSMSLFFEGDNFIAVHAGLNPKIDSMSDQSMEDVLWIRDSFYHSDRIWEKTVIFGHTPTNRLNPGNYDIYYDDYRNIIGIDTGAIYGGKLSCLAWPGRQEYKV
jgi:serine/threonine protein phosphatase 1